MPGPTHLLVANPTAQSGKNAARIAEAEALLLARGVETRLRPTLPAGATVDAVRDALRGDASLRTVIAMGGDGSFREVGSGLLDSGRASEIALAMLPTGTANDQGHSFGLSSDPDELERNVDVIVSAHETRLDAGRYVAEDERGAPVLATWFFDSAGWGLSARVLAERNKDRAAVEHVPIVREIYRDKLVYAGALVRVFLESYVLSDKFDATVIADGVTEELTGLTDLIVNATRVYAGAWVFDKTSRHDDGLFEVVPFLGKRDWASKAIVDLEASPLTEEGLNAVGIRHSRPFSAADLTIAMRPQEGVRPLVAQLDGEECVATSVVRIHVAKQAIRLIVPRDTADAPPDD